MTTFTTAINQIESLYVGYFGRAGDTNGTNYWINQLNSGAVTLAQIAASFSVQPEATAKYPYLANPNISDPGTFVDQVYQNMFNHTADAAGKAYWVGQLNAAKGNPTVIGQMILNIISGATGTDDTTIKNKTDVASDFTVQASNAGVTWSAGVSAQSATEIASVNDTTASVTAAKAQTTAYIATAPGPQQNFTLNIDTLSSTAQNANFNAALIFNPGNGALIQSLQPGDSGIDSAPLTGTGLSNGGTFTGSFNAAGVLANITLQGIPTHTVTSATGGAAAGYQGNVTGLVTLNNANSTSAVTIGAANFGIDKGGVAGTTTTGATLLSTVNVTNSPSVGANTQVFVNAAALAGAADSVTVNVSGITGTATAGAGAAQVVLLNDGAAGTAATPNNAYENETISANAATFLQLSNAASGVLSTTKLTLTGAGATQLSAAATGDFGKLTTIDASAQTGGVVITGATNINTPSGGAAFNAGAAGLLGTNTVLTSFTGGTGVDRLDITSMTTAAQLAAFTKLDGGSGRDILVLNSGLMNTTTALVNTGFETIYTNAGLTGTVDVSKLGTGVDTIGALGTLAGDITVNTVPTAFTFDFGGFGNAKAATFNGPAAAADVLNIGAGNTSGTGTLGALVTTAFETVNMTLTGSTNAMTIASITSTPTAGSLTTFNLVDNTTFVGADSNGGAFNVGGGTINVSGTHVGGFTQTGDVTAGALNVSGLNTGAAATATGFNMAGKSTAAINITGSAGIDTLTGSTATDTITGGAGNDILANMATGTGGVAVQDTLTGGTGADQFILRGDTASAALPGNYNSAVSVTDFTFSSTIGTTDFITLSATTANYNVTNSAAYALQAAATAQGAWTVQSVANAGAQAITTAANELVKLSTGVVTTGLTLQTAFNTAIGTGTVTGATADKSYFFTMYDITNSRMVVGIVQDHNGNTKTIETGDVVSLVGTVSMSATDYASLGTNNFSVVAA